MVSKRGGQLRAVYKPRDMCVGDLRGFYLWVVVWSTKHPRARVEKGSVVPCHPRRTIRRLYVHVALAATVMTVAAHDGSLLPNTCSSFQCLMQELCALSRSCCSVAVNRKCSTGVSQAPHLPPLCQIIQFVSN